MKLDRYPFRRNAAVIAAAAVIGAVGIGGVVTAQADPGTPAPSQVGGDGETNDDATDTGPDANPDEPGHQDASDTQETEGDEQDGAEGAEQGGAEAETNDDATDTGPDANPDEPGHQDASDE